VSWIELWVNDIECPHCGGSDSSDCVEFNTMSGDSSGIKSKGKLTTCVECDEEFQFDAYVDFDTGVDRTYKTKENDDERGSGER